MLEMDASALQLIIVQMIILILSITVHEYGHAFVADWLGDRLPRTEGRVTLNPVAHADPIGTLALPALGLFLSHGMSIGFGWGRPVRVNPLAFTRRFRMKTSHMLVAAAGPAMNILFGVLISIILVVLLRSGVLRIEENLQLVAAIRRAIIVNFVLAFFNLVPAPPLDGGTILAGLLPDRLMPAYERYAQYGMFVAMAVIMIPSLSSLFVVPAQKLYELWAAGVLGLP